MSKSVAPAAKKAAAKKVAAPAPVAAKPAAEPPAEAKRAKDKLVRDSFTIPGSEYAVLDQLKRRAVGLAQPAKKSELLRAGIKALAALTDDGLRTALAGVPSIKTGRPKGKKAGKDEKAAK